MNTKRVNQEVAGMVHIECPWCAGAASFVDGGSEVSGGAVDCADCGVRIALAPDDVVAEFARAA
jgi:hypothetical protein